MLGPILAVLGQGRGYTTDKSHAHHRALAKNMLAILLAELRYHVLFPSGPLSDTFCFILIIQSQVKIKQCCSDVREEAEIHMRQRARLDGLALQNDRIERA